MMQFRPRTRLAGLMAGVAMATAMAAGDVRAQSVWNGGSGALWTTPGNWTPSGVPTAASAVTINGPSPSAPSVTVAGQAADSVALTGSTLSITGAGTLAVTGAIQVAAGNLVLGPGAASGALSASVVDLAAGGRLRFDHGQAGGLTFSTVVDGAGSVVQQSGLTVLDGANSFTGGVSITGGTLRAASGSALGTGPVAVAAAGTLQVDTPFLVTGALSGAGAVELQNGSTLVVDSTTDSTFSGSITGDGSLEKDSAGVLTLTGASNILGDLIACCGTITISGGTFQAGGMIGVFDTLNVVNGADLTAGGFLGIDNGGTTVEGAGSTLTASAMLVGGLDGAGLRALDGGAIFSNGPVILDALTGNSAIFVDGAGSSLTVNGPVFLAAGQSHFVNVRNGGSLTVVADSILLDAGTALEIGSGGAGGSVSALDVSGQGEVRFDHSGAVAFSTPIVGDVSISKTGSGTTELTGANTTLGATTVTGGTLRVSGSLDSPAVLVSAGGVLAGSGTLSGSVTVNGGSLAPGASAGTLTIGGDLTLDAASRLGFELGAPGVVGGGVSDLLVVGGALTLDGAVDVSALPDFGIGVYRLIDYAGALVDNGLDVGATPVGTPAGGMAVSTAVANQVNLVVTAYSAPVYGQPLGDMVFWDGLGPAGDGRIQGGGGTWAAGQANWTTADGSRNGSWSPGFTVFSGSPGVVTLAGTFAPTGLQFAVGGYQLTGGGLQLTQAQTTVRVGDGASAGAGYVATIATPISGSGGLLKRDAGVLVLAGANTYTGATVVEGGVLRVDGSLTSAVTLTSGGELQGAGRVGGLTVAGTVAPGASIGVLTVGGAYVQQSGSTYHVEIDPTGASDRIVVLGAATIQPGSTVAVSAASGAYTAGTSYTILTATGGVTGTYSSLTQDFPFLDLSLAYGPSSVLLNVDRNGSTLASVAGTPNQGAAAGGAAGLVASRLASLTRADARPAFDSLSGEIHASAKGALIEDSRYLRDAIGWRARNGWRSRYLELPDALLEVALPPVPPKVTYWGQLVGAWGRADGDGNAARLDRDVQGVVLGGDYRLADGWSLGLATGYVREEIDAEARASSADVRTHHLAAYATGSAWGWDVLLGAGHSWNDVETRRAVAFTGFADALSADYAADTAQVFAETRREWRGVNPFLGVAHVRLQGDRFGETGGAAALSSEGHDEKATFATLGLRPGWTGDSVALSGVLAWRRLLGEMTPTERLSFAGGSTFAAQGLPIARDALVLEGQASAALWGGHASIGYAGQLSEDAQDHAVKASFRASF